MKVLVTGGTGFIGGHLAERLVADGHAVTAVVRATSDTTLLRSLGVELFVTDLLDESSLRVATQDSEVVYHLAAARTRNTTDPSAFHSVNALGTERLMRASAEAQVGRVVFCSTGGVHGPSWSVIGEDSPLRPDNLYRRTRVVAEQIACDYRLKQGLSVVVARLTGVYGPRDKGWLPLFREVSKGHLDLPGSGRHTFHLSYVDDVVEGLIRCARSAEAVGETYLIGTDGPAPLWEFVRTIAEEAGSRIRRRPWMDLPLRTAIVLGQVLRPLRIHPSALGKIEFLAQPRVYDVGKARRELGLPAGTPLREGVRRTLAWYRGHGDL